MVWDFWKFGSNVWLIFVFVFKFVFWVSIFLGFIFMFFDIFFVFMFVKFKFWFFLWWNLFFEVVLVIKFLDLLFNFLNRDLNVLFDFIVCVFFEELLIFFIVFNIIGILLEFFNLKCLFCFILLWFIFFWYIFLLFFILLLWL